RGGRWCVLPGGGSWKGAAPASHAAPSPRDSGGQPPAAVMSIQLRCAIGFKRDVSGLFLIARSMAQLEKLTCAWPSTIVSSAASSPPLKTSVTPFRWPPLPVVLSLPL